MSWKKIAKKLAKILEQRIEHDLPLHLNRIAIELRYRNYFKVNKKQWNKMLKGTFDWDMMRIAKLEAITGLKLIITAKEKPLPYYISSVTCYYEYEVEK